LSGHITDRTTVLNIFDPPVAVISYIAVKVPVDLVEIVIFLPPRPDVVIPAPDAA
jgi:hypothetical protein